MMLTGAGTTQKEKNLAVYSRWVADPAFIYEYSPTEVYEWDDYPDQSNYAYNGYGYGYPSQGAWGSFSNVLQFEPGDVLDLQTQPQISGNFAQFLAFGINEGGSQFAVSGNYGYFGFEIDPGMNLWVFYSDYGNSYSAIVGAVPMYGSFVLGFKVNYPNVTVAVRGDATLNTTGTVGGGSPFEEYVSFTNWMTDYSFVREWRLYNGTMSTSQFNSVLTEMTP